MGEELTELAFRSRKIKRWVEFPRVFGCNLTLLPFEVSRIFTIDFNQRKIRPLQSVLEMLASDDALVPLYLPAQRQPAASIIKTQS